MLYSDTGPHRIGIHEDVLFSLRYRDDVHIARARGEMVPASPGQDPWPDTVELAPDGSVADRTTEQ